MEKWVNDGRHDVLESDLPDAETGNTHGLLARSELWRRNRIPDFVGRLLVSISKFQRLNRSDRVLVCVAGGLRRLQSFAELSRMHGRQFHGRQIDCFISI